MSSALLSSRFVSLIAAVAVLGCASAPAPARIPDPSTPREPERTPITPPSTRTSSSFAYKDGTYAYDLRQRTTVTVTMEGNPPAEDTLQTAAGLTFSISSSTGTPIVTVMVDSLLVTSVRDTAVPFRRLAAPVVVQVPPGPGSIVTSGDSAALLSTCDSMEEAARALASDAYIQIPIPVVPAASWSDSTSLVLCRGGIPLTATRISNFRIAEIRESRDTILAKVIRQASLTIMGTGTQGARRITVHGQGTSETTFSYDLRAGRFLESTGQSVLELGFETLQQTEQIVQRSSSSIRLRAALPAGD